MVPQLEFRPAAQIANYIVLPSASNDVVTMSLHNVMIRVEPSYGNFRK